MLPPLFRLGVTKNKSVNRLSLFYILSKKSYLIWFIFMNSSVHLLAVFGALKL